MAKSREALGAAQSAYDLARRRYSKGLGGYLDVLTAEDGEFQPAGVAAMLDVRLSTGGLIEVGV